MHDVPITGKYICKSKKKGKVSKHFYSRPRQDFFENLSPWDPSSPNTSKNEFSAKTKLLVVRSYSNVQ